MTTDKQTSDMERANLTRLQIANVKNDSKNYTDKQVTDYIKASSEPQQTNKTKRK